MPADIEDLYELSPLQQGMLFHAIYAPKAAVYFEQSIYTIANLDVPAFERAWQKVVDRHPILRTSFYWEDFDKPLQAVHSRVKLPVEHHDWRTSTLDEQQKRLELLLQADRDRGFDLTDAPLMRLTLIRIGEDSHEFVWSRHHLLLDRWSRSLVFKEVLAFYEAFTRGAIVHLEDTRPYGDYIEWLQQRDSAEAAAFWRRMLQGIVAPTPLGLPATQASVTGEAVYDTQRTRLTAPATAALRAFARRYQITMNTLAQGAWALLLSRYCGEKDIVFGTTVSGRPASMAGIESMVGIFINTVPVRVEVCPADAVLPWLKKLHARQADRHEYDYASLVEIQGWSDVPRGLPLFESILVFENTPADGSSQIRDALNITNARSFGGRTGYPLTMIIVPGQEMSLRAIYEHDRFDGAAITRLLEHFKILLEGIVANPEAKLSQLPLLTDAERRRLLIDWNDTEIDYPKQRCVHQFFEEQVDKTPDAVALVFEDNQLSYAQLNTRTNQLAHLLIALGVGPEVLVALCAERSIEMVIGLLGILKAGGAYLPLDPTYPKERLAFMLEDSKATVLITESKLKDELPESAAQCIIDQAEAFDRYPVTNPATNVASDHLAYVIYTSGSTGQPKGVAMTHGPLCNLLSWHGGSTLAKAARTLQFASLSFDVSFQEMFSTWCSGGTLVLTPEELRRDTAALLRFMREKAITRLFLPFVVLQHMAELADEAPASLREIITAGEQLKITPQIADFLGKLDQCTLHNHYGPTESHVVTAFTLVGSSHEWPPFPPIGRPIANARIYVLDGHLNPTPMGVPGELHIGGDVLARGYLNRPALTAEKFIPNPFSDDPDARLYRTGDLARYLADGNIEFLGRIDDQVKIRGFRIELGEIEAVLNERVKACAVVAREDQANGPSTSLRTNKRLVAYIVPDENLPVALGDLRDFLRQKLPDYMLPSVFIVLDKLPVTPNGKLDRKALPAPDDSRPELEAAYVAPRTPAEEALAAIWDEVLKLDRIGIHDNFFELGGHSLLATQVIARVRDEFQVELPLRALFEAPTIEALNRKVMTNLNAGDRKLAPISRRTSSGSAPLSFAQQRLWFLDQLEPASAAYNMAVALRMTGALNVAALKASLGEIVRRHEALRTTVATNEGDPAQVIHQPHEFALAVADLSHLELGVRETEAQRLASDEAQRPFALASGPLFRARLFKLDDHQHLLVYTLHHIVSDGWSMSILSRELCALYRAYAEGRPSPLAELPIQYADYAVWQRGGFAERELQRQLSYWKKQLEGAPVLSEFPTDFPRPPAQRYQGAHESLTLSRELSERLKRFSRRQGATLFMTLLAAFKTLLHRYSGQQDIVVGTHIAGRTRQEIEGLIGFFIGTLVLRTDLSGNPSFRELLARVREVALGAYANQDVPFEKLVEELEPERSLSHTPFVQVVFNMLNLPPDAFELPGLTIERLPALSAGSKFDLTVYARERNEGLEFDAAYDIDLFAAATIKRLLRHFETLLQGIVADPDCRLSKLPLLTEAEAAARRNHIRPTQAFIEFGADAIEQSIAQRFEQQAQKWPHRLAVKTRTHEWSYEELNRAANRTAQALLRLRGAGAERVALLLDHDAPMIAAVVGVLKTGKSYVPLDPTYPRQRLAYMLADAQSEVLLTNSANLALAKSLNHLQLFNIDALDSPVSDVDIPVSPDAIAYTLYTSGSTGQPKGVTQNHRNVLHFIRAYTNNLHINDNDRLTLFSAYGFDSAVQDIFAALLNGAALYPVNLKEESLDDLTQWLIENEITLFHSTPSAYRYFVRALSGHESFPALRLVVLGGEAVYKDDVQAYQRHFSSGCLFVNGFGLTESTVNLQYFVDPQTEITRNAIPIGYPVDSTEILLLDEAGDPTELYGEIGILSAHVALRYLNQSELSKERFLADPNDPVRRIYRTGDMARQLADGSLEFAGRKDHQVKLRGYRIELHEIEAALSAHSVVRGCVAALKGNDGDQRLIAYVVPHEGASFTRAEFRAFLKEKLPDYMIPATFVALDRLPLTPSGKIDYRELPIPDDARADASAVFVAPRTPNEQTLADIFAAVLKLDQVGIHDNFFDLGGHSLLATQVISRVRKAFELDIPLRALFESPTVAGLSALILRKQAEALSDDELAQLHTEAQEQGSRE